ncbi:hypothetical protein X729_28500 [Mesorhizobium sp. L103C131B0]|nr:hypothetical protein X729_28500 [Mesorhizobium sp. L103C131B0]
MWERGEQRLVQQFVAQAAVEALDEGILHRLARRDVGPFHPMIPLAEDAFEVNSVP